MKKIKAVNNLLLTSNLLVSGFVILRALNNRHVESTLNKECAYTDANILADRNNTHGDEAIKDLNSAFKIRSISRLDTDDLGWCYAFSAMSGCAAIVALLAAYNGGSVGIVLNTFVLTANMALAHTSPKIEHQHIFYGFQMNGNELLDSYFETKTKTLLSTVAEDGKCYYDETEKKILYKSGDLTYEVFRLSNSSDDRVVAEYISQKNDVNYYNSIGFDKLGAIKYQDNYRAESIR